MQFFRVEVTYYNIREGSLGFNSENNTLNVCRHTLIFERFPLRKTVALKNQPSSFISVFKTKWLQKAEVLHFSFDS